MRELNTNTLCTSCAGCNRLYNEDFKGIYRCKNYFRMGDLKCLEKQGKMQIQKKI